MVRWWSVLSVVMLSWMPETGISPIIHLSFTQTPDFRTAELLAVKLAQLRGDSVKSVMASQALNISVTHPQKVKYWPLIWPGRSRDLITGLWLADTEEIPSIMFFRLVGVSSVSSRTGCTPTLAWTRWPRTSSRCTGGTGTSSGCTRNLRTGQSNKKKWVSGFL